MIRYKVYSFESIDVDSWKRLQDNSSTCDIFQTLEWAEMLKNVSEGGPHFLVLLHNSEPIGGCLLSFPKIPLSPFKVIEIRGGPLCISGYENAAIESLADYLERNKKNVIYKYAQPSPQLNSKAGKLFVKKGFKTSRNYTFLTDLTRTENELWSKLNKRARWGVRKAKRSGVKVAQATSEQEWDDFYRLHELHCLKHGYTSLLPTALFKSIYKILYPQKMAKLFLAQLDNKVIAGTLLLMHRKYVVFFRNASISEYLRFEPNNILQWISIKWGKENGAEIYDMGGIMLPTSRKSYLYGLYKYKKKWGGQLVEYNLYYQGNIYGILSKSLFRSDRGRRFYTAFQRGFSRVAGMSR